LTVEQVLAWAEAHHARTGGWPAARSGAVHAAAGETWRALNKALSAGTRGLPGGSSLSRLLAEHRGRRPRRSPLTENWGAINRALREGFRDLPGDDTLAQLLRRTGRGHRR
jgi:hypothetical protein